MIQFYIIYIICLLFHYNLSHNIEYISLCFTGLSQWLGSKEFFCQCRKCGFYHGAGKIPWRMKWQPAPIFLPGESQGLRSLAGYSPQDPKELDTTE